MRNSLLFAAVCCILLYLLVVAIRVDAQTPNPPTVSTPAVHTPPLKEGSTVPLIVAYYKAVQANKAFQDAVATFNSVQADQAKANGFPEGTTFTIDLNTGTVTAVLPKPPEAKAPEKK